jgi:hypothetical protein
MIATSDALLLSFVYGGVLTFGGRFKSVVTLALSKTGAMRGDLEIVWRCHSARAPFIF